MATSFQIPAVKGIIGDWVYYQTSISFSKISRLIDNDHSIREYPTLDDHLQRELSSNSRKISQYLLREKSRFFNSAIVGIYGDAPNWYNFEFENSSIQSLTLDDDAINSIGVLVFDGSERLFSIDGQHRIDGIKQALRTDDQNRFEYDELPVILVAHDDSRRGKIRTRRLFSEINTKAIKVGALDNLITNEDEPQKINARKLYSEFDIFNKSEYIALNKTANIEAESSQFTTILNLEQLNKELYKDIYNHRGFRPNDEVIENLYQLSVTFWNELVENINDIRTFLGGETIAHYRNNDGGSFMFRPIGLKHTAEMYRLWLSHGNEDTENFWERMNNINFTLDGPYWKDIVWDNAKHNIKKVSVKFMRNYYSYLLGGDYDHEYTRTYYNKQIGNEEVENYQDLPECPNQ